MDTQRTQLPLYRFFAGLTEYVFHTRLGVVDPPLLSYLAEMLCRFVHVDSIYRIRNLAGRQLHEVAEMLAEAEARQGAPQREIHRHIGDFTLFWTGIYPEALAHLRRRAQRDWFIDYCQQGKRSYYIASTLRTAENSQECDVLERLSHDFELCSFGLRQIREEWERQDSDEPPGPRPLLLH